MKQHRSDRRPPTDEGTNQGQSTGTRELKRENKSGSELRRSWCSQRKKALPPVADCAEDCSSRFARRCRHQTLACLLHHRVSISLLTVPRTLPPRLFSPLCCVHHHANVRQDLGGELLANRSRGRRLCQGVRVRATPANSRCRRVQPRSCSSYVVVFHEWRRARHGVAAAITLGS